MDYLSYKRVFKHGNNFCWEKLKKESCKAKYGSSSKVVVSTDSDPHLSLVWASTR